MPSRQALLPGAQVSHDLPVPAWLTIAKWLHGSIGCEGLEERPVKTTGDTIVDILDGGGLTELAAYSFPVTLPSATFQAVAEFIGGISVNVNLGSDRFSMFNPERVFHLKLENWGCAARMNYLWLR
jgi:hypothetical protein